MAAAGVICAVPVCQACAVFPARHMRSPARMPRLRHAGKRSKGDAKWLQQVRRTGTTTDRLAALSLLLREAALPNLKGLDDLLKLAGKRSGYRGIAGEVGPFMLALWRSQVLAIPACTCLLHVCFMCLGFGSP